MSIEIQYLTYPEKFENENTNSKKYFIKQWGKVLVLQQAGILSYWTSFQVSSALQEKIGPITLHYQWSIAAKK